MQPGDTEGTSVVTPIVRMLNAKLGEAAFIHLGPKRGIDLHLTATTVDKEVTQLCIHVDIQPAKRFYDGPFDYRGDGLGR